MMCYMDMTFCVSPNCKNDCGRQLTDAHRERARKIGLLIAQRRFCDDNGEVSGKEESTQKEVEE